MDNNYSKAKMISTKYTKGTDYNDAIHGYDDLEAPDPREIDDENMKKSYTLHTFPDADW